MTTILVCGWKVGCGNVKFTQTLQRALGQSLSQAKGITDDVLAGRTVELLVAEDESEHLLLAMGQLGAECAVAVPAR